MRSEKTLYVCIIREFSAHHSFHDSKGQYLANAQIRADEGFDSVTQAAEMPSREVFHAYGYYN